MKRTANLFLVALMAGGITLGSYKLFFEKESYKYVSEDSGGSFITTSNLTTSASGAGINEVDFTIAAEKTVNAVVHVKNMALVQRNPVAQFFYGSEATQKPQVGTGSGVIISPDGYIVTNNHVIDRATKLEVTLNNNKSYEAEVVGADANSDIALLKIDVENLPYLAFGDSDNAKIGEWVLAVGNPFNLTSTVTAGIVSAKARSLAVARNQSFIQTDAAVNPGNSGGALVNTNGDLIGINTAITSQTGSYVGYSFAVPSNIAKKVVDDLLEFGNVQKGILGVSALNVNTPEARERGIDEIQGVYISRVEEESGAQDAGLEEGDVIKQVDNVKVTKFSELTGYLSAKRPGDKVEVLIDRDGKRMTIPVTLKKNQMVDVPVMGFRVKNLSEKDKKQYKLDSGVKIVAVPQQYLNYDLVGKVIIKVDDSEIDDIDDAKSVFDKISRYGSTSITLIADDGERERLIFQ
ncbi:Do family serine endopeptidase [Croceitalea sp. MTPC9]|uniref:S1C family serine protease n=1 Tax=unclassified Croceitalea TaxID=2632280 RepID=UPI002B37644D|nr:Do family serine endopeptidase [Croceitalea sp. MTPC6]GMN15465.1 Do family serine endopeptidase [Croceitalea sp. MTPC9]